VRILVDKIRKLSRDKQLTPQIAGLFAQMQEIREKTLQVVSKLGIEEIDFSPEYHSIETIGTLLLHIAAIEWSWIFEDIDGREMDFNEWKYAFPLRPSVNIPQIQNQGVIFYIDRLNLVRNEVNDRLRNLTDKDLKRKVGSENQKYTIEWILYHIIGHEAIHLGQIQLLVRLYKQKKNKRKDQ